MTESKETYTTGVAAVDIVLARIAERIDILEAKQQSFDYVIVSDEDDTTIHQLGETE